MTTDQSAIWKYPLAITDEQLLEIPAGAELLSVGLDPAGAICLWAAVDPRAPLAERRIRVAGTGHPIEGSPLATAARFVGSVASGPFVWHVLDLGEPALDPPHLERFDALRRGEQEEAGSDG